MGQILIVDDEASVRNVCEKALIRLGLDVKTAKSGDEALELMGDQRFDFILTDIAMPGAVDGVALVEEIRRRSPSTDVAIMTGDPSVETAVSTLKKGAFDYLLKPFANRELEGVVTRVLEKRRASPEIAREEVMRQELEAAYAELQGVERLKDAIFSTLSHELRTPLTVALSASTLIEEGGLDPSQTKKFLGILSASLAKEKEVVEELLLFAKIRAKDLQLNESMTPLKEILDQTIQGLKVEWKARCLDVDVSWDSAIPSLPVDIELIRATFKQLFLNAILFNKKGGRIHVKGKNMDDSVHVSFADTGIGIPKEKLFLVSDGFYQAAEHLTRQVGGLGLGLAIVRRIIEAHGGSVSVESRESEGSIFAISLPKRTVAAGKSAGENLHETEDTDR